MLQKESYKAENAIEFCINVVNEHLDPIIAWANLNNDFLQIIVSCKFFLINIKLFYRNRLELCILVRHGQLFI